MGTTPDQIRQRYAASLMTLAELLQDSLVLTERHRTSLADAGWSDTAIDEVSADLLASLHDAAIHAVFREDGETVSAVREGHQSGL